MKTNTFYAAEKKFFLQKDIIFTILFFQFYFYHKNIKDMRTWKVYFSELNSRLRKNCFF